MNDLSRPELRLIIFYEWSCGTPAAEMVTKIGREGEARCIYARAGDHARLQSPNHHKSSSRSRLPTSAGEMGDESWVLYNNDTHRAVWISRGEEPPVHPKANLHEKKCLLSCFCDAKGMLYYELLPQGRTVNATTYSNQLASLAFALREKRPRRSAVRLLHDNARPHVAKDTQEKLQELNWDTIPHPPYSPDIAPSDYHLFRPLKLFLKEKRFAKYEDLRMAVFDFFDSQSAAFWKKGIDDLPERWLTVVTNDGQYIVD
uniref:Transposase n=1 Tax=Caenorhabditis japonica TaxID=281687 RepID=A0A8R1DZ90_CAEJA